MSDFYVWPPLTQLVAHSLSAIATALEVPEIAATRTRESFGVWIWPLCFLWGMHAAARLFRYPLPRQGSTGTPNGTLWSFSIFNGKKLQYIVPSSHNCWCLMSTILNTS